MSMQHESKKRELPETQLVPRETKAARCSSMKSSLDPRIINLALEWLDPKDLARASQVCKGWRNGITQYSWKQAANNVNSEAFQALHGAMDASKGKKLESQVIAAGLTKYIQPVLPPTIPDPSLKPEDLFLLVEVQAFDVKRAWCKCLDEVMENFDEGKLLVADYKDALNGASPCELRIPTAQRAAVGRPQDDLNPFDMFAGFVFDCMRVTLSLWRADTGQVHCLGYQLPHNDDPFGQNHLSENKTRKVSVASYFICDEMEPESKVGKHICRQNNYNFFCPYANVYLDPVMPKAGSSKEPEWLKKSQETGVWDLDPSGELWDYLARADVSCWVSGLEVEMRFSVGDDDCANDNVRSKRDFLLFLEHLEWK